MCDFNQFPTCPNCNHEDQDWWDGGAPNVADGTTWVSSCGSCGTEYAIIACVDISFKTTPVKPIERPDEDSATPKDIPEADRCPDCGLPLQCSMGGGVECPNPGCDYWFCF